MENINLACSEVYCLLEILGDVYKNKLPNKFLEFVEQNRKKDFFLEINEENFENLNISKDGLVLISYLNLKYWVEDENEKRQLMEIYRKNEEIKKEKINSYKQQGWLNQTEKKIETSDDENLKCETISRNLEEENKINEKSLILIKKDNIFTKIKNIINKIFNKKKE